MKCFAGKGFTQAWFIGTAWETEETKTEEKKSLLCVVFITLILNSLLPVKFIRIFSVTVES